MQVNEISKIMAEEATSPLFLLREEKDRDEN
jgi:hypothetical protein